jgi:hypothetical protein
MSANKFVLKHRRIEVDYTAGITPGLVTLTYKDGSGVKTFKTTEVTTENTALGMFVSVPLLKTIDTGGQMFGFFLPQLDVPLGQTEKFTTAGVYEKFSGPDSVPKSPPSWTCIELRGTAQTALVPEVQTAPSATATQTGT